MARRGALVSPVRGSYLKVDPVHSQEWSSIFARLLFVDAECDSSACEISPPTIQNTKRGNRNHREGWLVDVVIFWILQRDRTSCS